MMYDFKIRRECGSRRFSSRIHVYPISMIYLYTKAKRLQVPFLAVVIKHGGGGYARVTGGRCGRCVFS